MPGIDPPASGTPAPLDTTPARVSNVTPLRKSGLAAAMLQASERLKEMEAERAPLTSQQELELKCRVAANTGEATHIRLTLPKGSIISTAGDWVVVQYGPTAQQLAAFNRYNGEQMPLEMLEALMVPEEQYGPPSQPVDEPVKFLDKAGRPLDPDGEVRLAKPGAAMMDLVNNPGRKP